MDPNDSDATEDTSAEKLSAVVADLNPDNDQPSATSIANSETVPETAGDEPQEWEDDLLAAAEGRRILPQDDESDVESTPPATPVGDAEKYPSPVSNQKNQADQSDIPTSKKNSTNRSASIKYSPTEKYWLNRMYRSYRDQQAAQKEAKDKKEAYKPVGGLLTHANLMASFNNRFEGKFVDGYAKPRPARQQHSFGLWSAKNMRDGSEHMKGNIPDYWSLDKKGTKPANISLEENTDDTWDHDEYLGITADRPTSKVSKSQKRKAADVGTQEEGEERRKRSRIQNEDVPEDGPLAVFSRLYNQHRPVHRRRYSVPALQAPSEFDRLRQFRGDFGYSWVLERAQQKNSSD